MGSIKPARRISWARGGLPKLASDLSRETNFAKAKQALDLKSLREVLVAKPVLKEILRKKLKKRNQGEKMKKESASGKCQTTNKFVYGNKKQSILSTMAMSKDGRCGLTAGKLGQKAAREMYKTYRPGQFLEQIIRTTKRKAKEITRIKENHKHIPKKNSNVDEDTVMQKIIEESKKKILPKAYYRD